MASSAHDRHFRPSSVVPRALKILLRLADLGYQIGDEHIERLVESALVVEIA